MIGLFAGTDEGLYFIEPEKKIICELPNQRIEYIKTNRNGLAVAYVQDKGLFIRDKHGHWNQKWTGNVTSIKVTDNGTIIAGILPTALIISINNGETWKESKGISGFINSGSMQGLSKLNIEKKIRDIIEISGSIAIAVENIGILISHNLGSSWVRSSDGIGAEIYKLAEDEINTEKIYALTNNDLYTSIDFALNWKKEIFENTEINIIDIFIFSDKTKTLILFYGNKNNEKKHSLYYVNQKNNKIKNIKIDNKINFNSQPLIVKLPNSKDTLFAVIEKKIWATHNMGQDWLEIIELKFNIKSIAVCF